MLCLHGSSGPVKADSTYITWHGCEAENEGVHGAGLQSDSLEHLEVVNTCLQKLFDLIGPNCPPRLASILVRQRTHGRSQSFDSDMARM